MIRLCEQYRIIPLNAEAWLLALDELQGNWLRCRALCNALCFAKDAVSNSPHNRGVAGLVYHFNVLIVH
jgi:hypothetical protein